MKKLLLILFLCAAAVACSKSEDYAQPYTHRIIAIASANGIGDQGYIDMIVAGYERVYCSLDQSVYMQICTPLTPEEAYEIAIQSIEKAKDGVPTLVILGSSEFQPVVERLRTDASLSGSNVSILLFETDGVAPAANDKEASKADEYNYEIGVWMSNRFTATLQDCFAKDPDMSMRDLYYRLFQSTTGSHVCVFGADGYGSLYSTYLDEILTPPVIPDEDED